MPVPDLMSSIEYLEHQVDATGIRTTPDKVDTVIKVRSFLGLVNYYGKSVPHLSMVLHPLNHILKASVKWSWSQHCSKAFSCAKEELSSAWVLTHYDPSLPLNMAADASAYGVEAVLSHIFLDGSINRFCLTLPVLQREKLCTGGEGSACLDIWGEKVSPIFVWETIHPCHQPQPTTAIFGPKKGIPSLAAARLQ